MKGTFIVALEYRPLCSSQLATKRGDHCWGWPYIIIYTTEKWNRRKPMICQNEYLNKKKLDTSATHRHNRLPVVGWGLRLCFQVLYQWWYKQYYSIAEIFSFHLISNMSRLIDEQPNCERKCITRCVWRRNHCGLSYTVVGNLNYCGAQ